MPEGNEFHADVPDYYLPERRSVHQYGVFNISLKIVMGEILFQLQKYTIL
jgi:NADH-quinone oxidoreductase subunit D